MDAYRAKDKRRWMVKISHVISPICGGLTPQHLFLTKSELPAVSELGDVVDGLCMSSMGPLQVDNGSGQEMMVTKKIESPLRSVSNRLLCFYFWVTD
jgi:hypothetical protein